MIINKRGGNPRVSKGAFTWNFLLTRGFPHSIFKNLMLISNCSKLAKKQFCEHAENRV